MQMLNEVDHICDVLGRRVIFWEEIEDTLCTITINLAESPRQLATRHGLRVKC